MPKKPFELALSDRTITLDVARKRVKYCTIRIRRDGSVAVSVPLSMKEARWQAFVEEKKLWIEKSLARTPQRKEYQYTEGEVHYLLGRKVTLHVAKGAENRCRITDDEAWLTYQRENTDHQKIFTACWAEELEQVLAMLIRTWAPRMNVWPSGFGINRTKSRWGSCNIRTGELKFSIELAAKPVAYIESVVVHELNHLLEPTHNARFHRLMDHWLPDWKERKKKLNTFPREFI